MKKLLSVAFVGMMAMGCSGGSKDVKSAPPAGQTAPADPAAAPAGQTPPAEGAQTTPPPAQ